MPSIEKHISLSLKRTGKEYREVCIINFLIKNANFATLKIVHNFGVPKILQNLLAYRSLNKL